MRTFCTEGPINKEKNYYVPRTELLKTGLIKVDESKYFTIFAPRQSGKTTYFQFLIEEINKKREGYLPLWISFEAYSDLVEADFLHSFTRDFNLELKKFSDFKIKKSKNIEQLKDEFFQLQQKLKKDLVLIIDEIEGLQNYTVLNKFMHLVRNLYHKKDEFGVRSVILTGVSNITGIIQDSASPFNVSDQIDIPYFNQGQVFDLLYQHEIETGQHFTNNVKEELFTNTLGQPGLVSALARDLVEKKCPDGQEITIDSFYKTLDDFTRVYIDKNISNIIAKAKTYSSLMKEILFGKEVPFNKNEEKKRFLFVNGVIDDCDGFCCIKVPVYKKALYAYFKPLINGEADHFTNPFQRIEAFQEENGKLKMQDIIKNYSNYITRRGNIIFNNPNEGEYQYNLDAYLHSICEFLDAKVYPEVIEGGGKVDLLVLKQNWKWIVEAKVFKNISYYDKAKRQLFEYLERSNEKEGWLVFFSIHHMEVEYEKVVENDKTEHIWVLPVKKINPSEA